MAVTHGFRVKAKQYCILIVAVMFGGLLVSGVAYFMQGRTFGFSSATFSIPAFFVGALSALSICYLVLKNRNNALERIVAEQGISAELKAEIAEHERTEEALRESEQELRKAQSRLIDAIDSLPIAFSLFDAENRLLRVRPESLCI
jgi:hypothetical protein